MSETELYNMKLLLACVDIAQQAGKMILTQGFSKTPQRKSDGSFVTQADMESHEFISKRLLSLLPDAVVISEEGDIPKRITGSRSLYWLVDPIDGTHDFIDGLQEWGIHLALISNGQPVLGVIEIPELHVTYYAVQGEGAYRQYGRKEPQKLVYKKESSGITATVSQRYFDDKTKEMFRMFGVTKTISHSNAINPCIVAEGQADLYVMPKPVWYWDAAAGSAIARQAGCKTIDLHGAWIEYPFNENLRTEGFIVVASDISDFVIKSLRRNTLKTD